MADIVKLVEKMLPPLSPLDTWRTLVAITVMLLCVHAAWAIGWIPGLDGFAQTSSVASIRSTMETNAAGYKQAIVDVQRTQNTILQRAWR